MKKEKKKTKKIVLIVLLVLLVIIAFFALRIYKTVTTGFDNNTIKAVKTEELDGKKVKTEIKIKFKNYKVETATKTINCISNEQAESEYKKYDFIKQHEIQDIELELKGKKLIISMSEDFLKKELGYTENDMMVVNANDIPYEPIQQDKLISLLASQGYKIK